MTTARVRELAERLQGTCESIFDEQDDWTGVVVFAMAAAESSR